MLSIPLHQWACLRPGAILALALMILSTGCSPTPNDPSLRGESGSISDLIDDLNDAGSDTTWIGELFAAGSSPSDAELTKYVAHSYSVATTPDASGTTATVPIKLRERRTGRESGPIEWTFTKEGADWKIAAAPLP
ncbi:hypothetical protein BH23PLA1_BH23PLA1_07080 [soil metagenome]